MGWAIFGKKKSELYVKQTNDDYAPGPKFNFQFMPYLCSLISAKNSSIGIL